MSRRESVAVVLGLVLMFAGGGGRAEEVSVRSTEAHQNQKWTQKMRELQKTLRSLVVDVSSDQRFQDPKNKNRIEANANKLAELAHELKTGPDPGVSMVAGMFSLEASRAHRELVQGRREYARGLLKSLTGYCISCHTRGSGGPRFPSSELDSALSGLRLMEQAEYHASVRQFDRAFDLLQELIGDAGVSQRSPIEWERAVRYALAIAVRVKQDPDSAQWVADRVGANVRAPYFLKQQSSRWVESIRQWRKETGRKFGTEEGMHAEALRLLASAKEFQKYPADRSADVIYLRATAVLHDLLATYPDGQRTAEALYLAGQCYEVLRDAQLWELHEHYYMACIYKKPRSEIAQGCYRHFEESVYLGYSGSGGVALPDDVLEHLKSLREMAYPAPSSTKLR